MDRVEKGITAMVMSQLVQKHFERSVYLVRPHTRTHKATARHKFHTLLGEMHRTEVRQ